KYFCNNRISIIYSNPLLSKKRRIENALENVFELNPSLIISFSTYSLIQNILYKKYPVLYISFGEEYSPNQAHLYLYKNLGKTLALEEGFGGYELDIIKGFIYDFVFFESKKTYIRKDFGFEADDFIIITIGNRINTEIQQELADK